MSAATLDKLPAEILEGIFAELEHDRDTLDTLGLTCHVLLARTRPHRFPIITLHNYNFDNFMDLTYASPWNTILPHVKQLVLGTTMFPLSHCYPGKRTTDGELLARDLTTWAAQFDVLQSLDLRGAFWPALPQYFKNALLSLRVEHLRVCLVENSLTVTDFRTVVFPTIRPKSLSISGPLWRRKLAPFYPTYFPETPPFYIHYLQLDEAKPIQEIIDWLRHHDPPPPIIHLYVELPGWQDSPLGHLIIEILHLISPVHLQLKLPTVVTGQLLPLYVVLLLTWGFRMLRIPHRNIYAFTVDSNILALQRQVPYTTVIIGFERNWRSSSGSQHPSAICCFARQDRKRPA